MLKKINILDIGCGGGLLSEPMCRLGANVVGIDASKKNIAYLDFGVSQDSEADNPLAPSHSLIKFKEETGAFNIIRKAYNKTFKF